MTSPTFGAKVASTATAGLALLALAGCGGGSSSKEISLLRARGARGLLVRSDLPGWAVTPPEREKKEPALEKQVAACLRVPLAVIEDKPAEVLSPEFKRGGAEIRNDVTVRSSVREAERADAVLTRPSAPRCIADGVVQSLRRQLARELPRASLGAAVTDKLPVARTAASVHGYRFVLPLHVGGSTTKLVFDAVLLRSGAATATISFGAQNAPVDAALERRLTIATARRLAGIG